MMAVIINQSYAGECAFDFEAAANACEFAEALTDQFRGNVEIQADGGSSGGVAHIVNARRRRQHEMAKVFTMVREAESALEAAQFNFADDEIGLAGSAVGYDRALHAREDGLHVGLVEAEDCGAVERHAIHEFEKRGLNLLERMVLVEMLAVDRGDDGDDGREQQKGTIAFISLDDHVFALADARISSGGVDAAADDERGIEASGGKDGSYKGGGGRLAVRAGDGDAVFQAHQLGEHFRAGDDGDFELARFDDFRIIRTHGGGHDDNLRAVNLSGLMGIENSRAEIPEALRGVRGLQIRSGDRVAQREQDFRDAAHTAAADADEVNLLKISEWDFH